jgi:hypothetical protein
VKDLKQYELDCQKNQYYIGIDHIKKTMNDYIHNVNNLNKEWARKTIMGEDIQIWMDRQLFYVNNPDNNGTMFVNQHQGLIDAVKDLKQYVLECKKKFQELKKEHKKKKNTDVHQLNNVNDQESVMTSNVNHDNEVVQSHSRKRKRSVSAEEDNVKRGPKPRINGYTVKPVNSDQFAYFYIFQYGETDLYKGGWATIVDNRLKEINNTTIQALEKKFPETHEIFSCIYTKLFDSKSQAHEYEQNFFEKIELEDFVKRLDGEFYDIPNDTLHRILRDE